MSEDTKFKRKEPIEKRVEASPELARVVAETVPTSDGGGRAPTKYEKGRRVEELDRMTHSGGSVFSGVGESRVFAAEPGTFEDQVDWSTLTLNGQPIPENLWATLPYSMTDQGSAEFNAGKQQRRAEVVRDAPLASRSTDDLTRFKRDQSIEDSVDQYRESIELMEREDPLGVLMQRHLPPGRRGLWLSERNVSNVGTRRNGCDYETVLDGNGQRIVHGRMFLASIPEAMAQAAERNIARKNLEQTQSAVATVQGHADQLMSEAGMRRANRNLELPKDGIEFLDRGQTGMIPGDFGHQFKG